LDHAPFVWQHKLRVDPRSDKRGCGVTYAYNVCSRGHLEPREVQLQLDDELKQLVDKGRVIAEVRHQIAYPAQVCGFSAWTLNPALNQLLLASALA